MTHEFNDASFQSTDRITDELIAAHGDWLFDDDLPDFDTVYA